MLRRKTASMLVEGARFDLLPDGPAGPRRFKIKAADSSSRRGLIEGLLRDRYAWRGYQSVSLAADQSIDRFTLAAIDGDMPIGTITVCLDVGRPLGADDAFGDELAHLRRQGRRLCEFTKLAIDPTTATKRVLASLFHVAYIVAHRLRGYDTVILEVNPRHVVYYQRMLGCQVIGSERLNRHVKAPAVLLSVDFAFVREQIGQYGGHPEQSAGVRTLYPFAFSLTEEAGILSRLQRAREQKRA
ncbi:MAG: long-chain N-acyl amino acid synthase [Burkholderiales bacterium]|nr:long-chain N-acyl amino acid synthase [Burkholderiales bacterium]